MTHPRETTGQKALALTGRLAGKLIATLLGAAWLGVLWKVFSWAAGL